MEIDGKQVPFTTVQPILDLMNIRKPGIVIPLEPLYQQEMAKVAELKNQKVVDQLIIGEESKNAWMIINANNKDEVSDIMKS
ncbi:MAG: hypothetical protein HeimC2_28800, partial [Candidatus Heimdallarchaeota archaeon LC_2]